MIKFLANMADNIALTSTDKKILDFFLDNGPKICFMNSGEIAESLKISDTSVIRFVKRLGYKNFSEFKLDLRNKVADTVLTPTQKLKKNKDLLESESFNMTFFNNINDGISKTFNSNSINTIKEISAILLKSKKKFIVGFKSTSGIVSFFGLRLGFMLKEVETLSNNNSELIKKIVDITSKDVLVIFAYPKYSKTYNLLIEIAKKARAKIIIITDKESSPVRFLGDLSLIINTDGLSFFNSMVTTQAVCEYFLTYISKEIGLDEEKRISIINDYLNQNL
ncbi:MurR/RpiR family transcriptional regulator [uncultured Ilyobacter sp.]|uniref:MurR/RpiR family transcriptional regulator n=1 Tax=uncultured Ilyobacter sp. TaxID=544433 RepID=UPI0029C95B47|nr:MurR/RpiR family transcriptional regulator [uncultured Ilyobacter sp.]